MVRIRPLPLALAMTVGLACGTSFAATDMNSTHTNSTHESAAEVSKGKTAGHGSSVNTPGGTGQNDSAAVGTKPGEGTTGGSSSTGEATGTGAGSSGGTAEDQDSQ